MCHQTNYISVRSFPIETAIISNLNLMYVRQLKVNEKM